MFGLVSHEKIVVDKSLKRLMNSINYININLSIKANPFDGKNRFNDRMRSTLNILVTVALLIIMMAGLEVLDSALVNSPVREMTPESENTSEEEVHFFYYNQRISKKTHHQNISVHNPSLLLSSSFAYQSNVSKKARYILYGALLI